LLDQLQSAFSALLAGVAPVLPWLGPALVVLIVLLAPLPGRGPGLAERDPWRGFRYAPRRRALERAGGRCEAPGFIVWGRCEAPAAEVDHVYPWSRGGATVLSNAQALCAGHNRAKSSLRPPWWYVLGLERRRRGYFPDGEEVRVSGAMTAEDRAARASRVSAGGPPPPGARPRRPSRSGRR